MQIVSVQCPACGGVYGGRVTSKFITCEYCGSRYALSQSELGAFGFVDADGDGYDDNDSYRAPKTGRLSSYGSEPLYAVAEKECEKFLDDPDVDRGHYSSTRKILQGLDIKNNDDVYLIHDDTLFKSGKNGFAITYSGLYCREMAEGSAHFISWDQFKQGDRPRIDDSYIRQRKTSICYFTDDSDERELLLDLYVRLWQHAQSL
jgi:hypothetical protein